MWFARGKCRAETAWAQSGCLYVLVKARRDDGSFPEHAKHVESADYELENEWSPRVNAEYATNSNWQDLF